MHKQRRSYLDIAVWILLNGFDRQFVSIESENTVVCTLFPYVVFHAYACSAPKVFVDAVLMQSQCVIKNTFLFFIRLSRARACCFNLSYVSLDAVFFLALSLALNSLMCHFFLCVFVYYPFVLFAWILCGVTNK